MSEINCNNCPICNSDSSGSSSVSSSGIVGTGSTPNKTAGSELLGQDVYSATAENPVSGTVPGTVIMDVLANIQSVLPDVINSISNVVGFMCELYFPFGTSSAYGKNDNKIRYATYPQIRRCFIGANLFAQANIGVFDGSEFAPYLGEQPYLMTFNFKIPENTKVKIYYGSSCRWMKVRSHQAYDGANTYLMILNMLSPCTSAGEEIHDTPLPTEKDKIVVDPVNKGTRAGQNLI